MNNSVTNTARLLWAGLRALLVLTVVCGVIYPLAVTGVGQALFHDKANGSEISAGGKVVGSSLIGQSYNLPLKKGQETPEPDLKWFQGRPANGLGTNSVNTQYKLILSGATNRAGDNKDLIDWVTAAKKAVVKDNSVNGYTVRPSDVPADAVTSSGSGLDPDISPGTRTSRSTGSRRRTACPSPRCRSWSTSTPTAAPSASSASPASTSSNSTSRSGR